MNAKAWLPALALLVGYPLASRYAVSQGWTAAWLATVPPIVIYCGLLAVFANTLRPGNTPLISRFARLEQGELDETLTAYTRRLTVVWCAFFALMAVLALALAAWAPYEIWALHTFFVSYVLIAALFLGEYAYRRLRYPRYRHASPWQLLRNVRSHGLR